MITVSTTRTISSTGGRTQHRPCVGSRALRGQDAFNDVMHPSFHRSRVAILLALIGLLLAGASVGSRARAVAAGGRRATASTKAGVASSRYLVSDPQKLTDLGISWSYDWSATAPPATPGLTWVPMLWGAGSVTPGSLAALRRDRADGRAVDLLGFNEPDSGSQSNLTPSQAAALWPKLESTRLRLGSPATTTPFDGWLAQFMALAHRRHLRVDFIALHVYEDFTNPNAVASLKRQLEAVYRAYGRPIWITEIGTLNIRSWHEPMAHPASEPRAIGYLRQLVTMLDGLPFVQRYAWFTDDCWNDAACHTSSLFTGGGQMTALGHAFAAAVRPPRSGRP
jgi:hypothetical protein